MEVGEKGVVEVVDAEQCAVWYLTKQHLHYHSQLLDLAQWEERMVRLV